MIIASIILGSIMLYTLIATLIFGFLNYNSEWANKNLVTRYEHISDDRTGVYVVSIFWPATMLIFGPIIFGTYIITMTIKEYDTGIYRIGLPRHDDYEYVGKDEIYKEARKGVNSRWVLYKSFGDRKECKKYFDSKIAVIEKQDKIKEILDED